VDVHEAVVLSLLGGLSRRRLGDRLRRSAPGPMGRAPGSGSFPDILCATARRPISAAALDVARGDADRALARAARRGIVPLVLGTAGYPQALEAIVDPPVVLWCRGLEPDGGPGGGLDGCTDSAVAVVGARAATAYARAVAARLGTDLADRGVTVVSGLARGVDVAAHGGALESAGDWCTVAVLGCGVDVTYPPEHGEMAEAIAGRGAIVSEFPPGTPPRAEHFPRRNRVISGLARAVVVVEASARSGALITADYALDQGRDVLAVPGNVLTGRNRGGHSLLRDGAKIVEDADDILEELRFGPARRPRNGAPPAGARDALLRCMESGESYALEDLTRESGLDAAALLPRLLELELAGRVRRDGAQFVRSG
jgi:DNA processing protein